MESPMQTLIAGQRGRCETCLKGTARSTSRRPSPLGRERPHIRSRFASKNPELDVSSQPSPLRKGKGGIVGSFLPNRGSWGGRTRARHLSINDAPALPRRFPRAALCRGGRVEARGKRTSRSEERRVGKERRSRSTP